MKRAIPLLAAAALAAPAAAAPCTGPACNLDLLRPVLARVAAARGARGSRPVHILQIGDSHTAGDAVTGGWRELLQARGGSGGRGVLAAGRPYDGYLTRGVTASMSPGWSIAAGFGRGSASPRPAIGVSGFSLTSTRPGATLGLVAEPNMMFNRVTICALANPQAGALILRVGNEPEQRLDFDSPTARPECRTVETSAPQSQLQVTAEDDPVTITSWATFRDDGGAVLSNVGIVGSQLVHFGRADDAVVAEELRAYRPDMIVLAFGTNEGFTPTFNAFSYEVTLRTQIGRLRRLAGNVPILLLGAPDALTRNTALQANAPGAPLDCRVSYRPAVAAAPPPAADPFADAIAGFAMQARAEGEAPAAPPPAQPAPTPPSSRPLFAPPALAQVRAIQRKIAGELRVAYWDWQARMGGGCAAAKWVADGRMRGDFIHFKSQGGRDIARLLQADLDAAAR
ncbi:GDSL-type esterase/lipase family protein [Sphingomonas jatrophae]|uniref:GDSL-like Lipase/Acylhydrolase family protein n=1 Tax=Sphingomonas jatrophae TaxID=1166337 RepID=A0A1I6MAH9_9SPHN|nr:GDSL-type esterase/lipase family protein [Sphingomonas jatrophae]SFS12719.1 GDSL-like Lipase/Acylhydrolase family protein [Sphingomonas jatrophae]